MSHDHHDPLDADFAHLHSEVTDKVGVVPSANALLSGLAQALANGIEAAKSKGATDVQLERLNALHGKLVSSNDSLAGALSANPIPTGPEPSGP